jgi:ADP-ribose pyrophosphatase
MDKPVNDKKDGSLFERFEEKTVKSELVFSGKILKVFFDKIMLPNSGYATREKVSHPGAVAIVPVTADRMVILVKQFRYPLKEILIEIPAGKLDGDEPAIECARRELFEEAGAVDGTLSHLITIYTSPGFSDEKMEIFLATDFKEKSNNPDSDEFLYIFRAPMDECIQMIRDGRITDAKTVIGILCARFLI